MPITSLNDLYCHSKEMLEGKHGTISITFANRTHIYTGNDVIGNCLQEWLPDWFQFLGLDIRPGQGTQVFPDFVVCFDNVQYAMEVKAWNITNSPAFDLANFHSFIEQTYSSPNKINAQYFIMGYKPDDDGFSQGFTVEKIFLKHIWEITAPSTKYPIGLQVKRNSPYAIRPFNFYKDPDRCFQNRDDFINAIKDTYQLFPSNSLPFDYLEWYEKVNSFF